MGWLCFPAANLKVSLLRSETILSLQRLVRTELALLRRLAIDRRMASILLPVLRRSGLASGLVSGGVASSGVTPKTRTAA
jgi:hypothetical protein